MRVFVWELQIVCGKGSRSCCKRDFFLGSPCESKIQKKKGEKGALARCEKKSEFRPRSGMRLAQAVVVVSPDKLLKIMTGRWSGMEILHVGSRRQLLFLSCLEDRFPFSREWERTWTY